jgi:hypothetical protein
MINILLFVTMTAYWAALFVGSIGLIAIRTLAARQAKLTLKQTLFVILTPLSIGYYLTFPKNRPLRTLHRITVALVFVLTLLASVWVFYTRYA